MNNIVVVRSSLASRQIYTTIVLRLTRRHQTGPQNTSGA